MKCPSLEFDDATAAACHGTIEEQTVAELVGLLGQDEAACDEYLVRTGIHAHLAVIVPGLVKKPYRGPDALDADSDVIPRWKFRSAGWGSRAFAAGFAGVMMVGGLWVLALVGRSRPSVERHVPPPSVVARFGAIESDYSSGGVDRLVDGRAQGSADAALESVFLRRGARGGFCFDLGRPVAISKINSYSWHDSRMLSENHVRATQKYTVWGFAGDDPPAAGPPSAGNGWERIARIDTDDFFDVIASLDRPAQQACSITSESRSLGRYRFLLFEVHPTVAQHDQEMDHTFYGEIDVYAEP